MLLTICIPTYNRSSFAINQLDFLKKEIVGFEDMVNVILSDNNSDSYHQLELKNYHERNPYFQFIQQEQNLGLIGNVYYLLGISTSEYVWFLGDDDILKSGVIRRNIKTLLENQNVNMILLNYCSFFETPENIITPTKYQGYFGLVNTNEAFGMKLFRIVFGSLMFISAIIYRKQIISITLDENFERSIEDPLLFSFLALKEGNVYFEDEVMVLNRLYKSSWEEFSSEIYAWGIPRILLNMPKFGYDRTIITNEIYELYAKNKGNFIRMLIYAPVNIRIGLVKQLSWKSMILLLVSLYYNFFKLISVKFVCIIKSRK